MKVTWYPKNFLVAVVLLIAFAATLTVAMNFRAGATVGVGGLLAYLFLDVVLTFVPAQWWPERDHRSLR